MGGKGDNGLAVQIVFVEEGKHYLWIGAPPYWSADKDGFILVHVLYLALEVWLLVVLCLFFYQFGEGIIWHVVAFLRDNLKLAAAREFLCLVGHQYGVAHLHIAHSVVLPGMRGEYN